MLSLLLEECYFDLIDHKAVLPHQTDAVQAYRADRDQLHLEVSASLGEDRTQPLDGIAIEHSGTIFRHKDPVDVHLKNAVPPVSDSVVITHRPRV